MTMKNKMLTIFAVGVLASPLAAMATVTITQGTSAPAYSTTLNFDEAGGPTGSVPTSSWQGIGITALDAGDGAPQVDDWATLSGQPWLGDGNSFFGNFGVFLTFDSDLAALSVQAWDPSGPPSPFGGGLGVFVFNDGVEVASSVSEPAWGGVGDEWFNIVASGGMLFDEVRILGFGFDPTTYVDNLSWNTAVPVPGALVLFASGLAGLGFAKRRKAA